MNEIVGSQFTFRNIRVNRRFGNGLWDSHVKNI